MNITFTDKKLRDIANNDRKMQRVLGAKRAKLFRRRLSQLQNAESLEGLRHQPGRFHELTGNYKGYWACDLDQPYRLIFTPHEEPIPENEHGQYVWIEIKGVEITEISDYH